MLFAVIYFVGLSYYDGVHKVGIIGIEIPDKLQSQILVKITYKIQAKVDQEDYLIKTQTDRHKLSVTNTDRL